jgi:hypothetical protein
VALVVIYEHGGHAVSDRSVFLVELGCDTFYAELFSPELGDVSKACTIRDSQLMKQVSVKACGSVEVYERADAGDCLTRAVT